MVTSPISTQEKMKLIPTPLWRSDTQLDRMKAETEAELSVDADMEPGRCNVSK